jgi:O-antigen ligase
VVSVIVSPAATRALGIFKAYIFEGILFWLLFVALIDSKKKLFHSIQALGWLVVATAVFALYQFLTLFQLPPAWWGPGLEPRRVVSFFTYPNAVALLIGPILALYAGFLIFKDKVQSFLSPTFLITVNVLGVLLLILTFSRGAWIGYVVAILFLMLFSKYKKVILALLIIAATGVLLIPTSRHRLIPIFTGSDPASIERVKLWKGGAEIIKTEPFFGAGLMGFRHWYGSVRQSNQDEILNYPHNFFLNFWTETGLFGLFSILAMLAWTVWWGIKIYRKDGSSRPIILSLFAALQQKPARHRFFTCFRLQFSGFKILILSQFCVRVLPPRFL